MDILDSDFSTAPNGAFEFYRDFINAGQVEDFIKMLDENRIPYRLEKSEMLLTGAITGHGLLPFAVLKLRPEDFKKVNVILEKQVLANPQFIDTHYLQQFDARELLDVVKKPDEWTPEDVVVARKILERRGIPIPAGEAERFKEKRHKKLRAGKQGNTFWMVVYLACVLVGGVLWSPLFLMAGIGMGWYYWQDKTIDTEGLKFFTFEPNTRLAGQVIFYLGWVCLAVGFGVLYWLGNR
jgi:hypothetical protein